MKLRNYNSFETQFYTANSGKAFQEKESLHYSLLNPEIICPKNPLG